MMIKDMKTLVARIDEALEAVANDGRYVETMQVLQNANQLLENRSLSEVKEYLVNLYNADLTYPMHPLAAALLIDIYEEEVENGDADAMCDLGSLYYTGRCGEQDYKKAAKYYEMADKAGNRQATENLGYIYYYGRIGAPDYEKAFKYFAKGALDDHLRPLYKMGDMYKNGYYVEKDEREAFIIYNHCLEILTEEALWHVGADIFMRVADCFYEGCGTERDVMMALRFYNRAEERFYERLMDGDFYQQASLEHVLDREQKIRAEIAGDMLPDLSWAKYNG